MFDTGGKRQAMGRRACCAMLGAGLLAGCAIVPRGVRPAETPPPRQVPGAAVPAPTAAPAPGTAPLPQDAARHRIALLVPITGRNADVGQSIANATMMALIDTDAQSLRITTYDTATGAGSAAARAIADGNALILGPLLGENIGAVSQVAKPAGVPLIAYSNNIANAQPGVFVMGVAPGQSVARTVRYAAAQGTRRIAALVPDGEYGRRIEGSLASALADSGVTLAGVEHYDRGNTSIVSAAGRLKAKGGYDGVLIADGPDLAARGAQALRQGGAAPLIMGTELWSGEEAVATDPALRGALFSAVSDARYRQFSESYRVRYGTQPYRIATLGYDSVLLALRIAQDWRVGRPFPVSRLTDPGGFLGLDGPFRFAAQGFGERSMEVRKVEAGRIAIVSEAPARFPDIVVQ